MLIWVLYDIREDKARTKVAKHCQQAGLFRVQYSVFLGKVNDNQKDTLELQIKGLIDEDHDSVYIFPMSQDELRETVLLGQAFDKKRVKDEVYTLFV